MIAGRTSAVAFAIWVATGSPALQAEVARQPLLVCADPNNLPFSNRAEQGFENQLARLIARDLHRQIRYVWWAQRRGFVRNTLNDGKCNVWPGVATQVDTMATTRPYYRSTYVFVTRRQARLSGLSLDDPRLKSARIGVQMIGNESMNTPPAHAVAERGLTDNVRGYMLYGDYREPNPPADIVRDVAEGHLDVALVWGPLAGYFAQRSAVALRLEPVIPADDPHWPMVYSISVGVRKTDPRLRNAIDEVLEREAPAIGRLLRRYGVPSVRLERPSHR